jgi:hypothetical protein
MRFEISYRGGSTHEVEVPTGVAALGRDPGCDIVLNDSKCSRRHAIVEDGPEGIVVIDTGSANGVLVDGRRVEKARLRPGDTFRLGDVQIKLLAEIGETVVMAPDDMVLRTVVEAPRPPAREPAPRDPAARPPSRGTTAPRRVPEAAAPRLSTRPATVSVLAGLWALFVPASIAAFLVAAGRLGGGALAYGLAALAGLAMAGLGATMALGLRALSPWARHLQIATAAVGLVLCPFTLASATVLLYMSRPEVKAAFEGNGRRAARADGGAADATFALSLVGMLVLGLALTAIAALVL